MRSIRQILVAIKDPAARLQPGLEKAVQLARALGVRLELFQALTWPIYLDGEQSFTAVCRSGRDSVLKRLQRLADRFEHRGRRRPIRISVAAQWDQPAYEAIIRRASRIEADLIVAERHNGAHSVPWLLRLNDWELLRRSPVPVLLIKHGGQYDRPVVLAAVDPTHSLDKPAQLDDAILNTSSAITGALRGRLHSVHAYVALTGEKAPTYRRRAAALRARYERLLDAHHIPKTRRHLLDLPAADAIQRVAANTRASIVALGAVSRSGWQRLLIGNTAEELLDPLHCDLLVLKPPHFKARVPRRPIGPRLVPPLSMYP